MLIGRWLMRLTVRMHAADEILRMHAADLAILREQMIQDLPRALSSSVGAVLRHVMLYALPNAVSVWRGSLH